MLPRKLARWRGQGRQGAHGRGSPQVTTSLTGWGQVDDLGLLQPCTAPKLGLQLSHLLRGLLSGASNMLHGRVGQLPGACLLTCHLQHAHQHSMRGPRTITHREAKMGGSYFCGSTQSTPCSVAEICSFQWIMGKLP